MRLKDLPLSDAGKGSVFKGISEQRQMLMKTMERSVRRVFITKEGVIDAIFNFPYLRNSGPRNSIIVLTKPYHILETYSLHLL